jgi:hypothetical protein
MICAGLRFSQLDDRRWGYSVVSNDQADEYKERYVAFLDLLGFKWQVELAEKSHDERTKLREVLRLMKETLTNNPYIGFRFNYFSDCVVLSVNRTPDGLREMFNSISAITSNLLQYDVFVRGGLTAGGAHHGKEFLYGTAVNRAYALESEQSKNPMTLLSEEVVQDAKSYGDEYTQWLVEEEPGRHFIHYLIAYALYRPTPIYTGKVILDDPGGRIIDFVQQRLNNDKGRVLAKAEWFQAYWNRTVAVHGVFKSIEAGVTERYRSRGPTIMVRRIAGPLPPMPQT